MHWKTLDFLYLNAQVLTPEWSFLRPYLHPGTLGRDGHALVVAIDLSFDALAAFRAPDWTRDAVVTVRLPHNLVAAALEVRSRHIQFGFADLDGIHERLAAHQE